MTQESHKLARDRFQPCGQGCRNRLFIGVLLALAWLEGCSTAPSVSRVQPAGPEMIQLEEAKNILGADETVVVMKDAVYQTPKHYRGVSFAQFLKSTGHEPASMAAATMVQFVCSDGYDPIAPLATLLQDGAFLATRDLDAPPNRDWIPFKSGNSQRDPGPIYLVWPQARATSEGHPWPYGILALRLGQADTMLGPAQPKSARFQAGFNLFRENCMTCHSLNGVGGTIGIDLNVPRNVFEYWQADQLPALVANPAAFRRNAKMPAFDRLGHQGISDILAYVKHMQGHKLQPRP